jgi:protein-S-isoprenylcysteine O-methyltransferase Ste14
MFRCAFSLAIQLLPGVLLILFGWGFDDVPAFFANPARAALAAVIVVAVLAAILLRLDLDPLRRGSGHVGSQTAQLAVLLMLSLALLWFLPFADHRKLLTLRNEAWRCVGLLFCAIGTVTRLLALKTLGPHFSAYVTLQPNHRLVQNGIYARIRHPLYLSLLLLPTGIALVFASKLAWPIALLAAIFVFDRMRSEERLLADRFAAEFEEYRRRTWRLIPLLF